MMKTSVLIFVVVVFCLQSCEPNYPINPETALDPILKKCVSTDSGASYKLDSILLFKWDRLIILTAYFDKKKLEACSGVSIPHSKLEGYEATSEYLFIKDKKIITHLSDNNKILNKIILMYDTGRFINNGTQFECGIQNNPNLRIRLVENVNRVWKGKTFLIYSP